MKELTKQELETLKKKLEDFENQTYKDTGMKSLNGGYAKAEMFDYDDEFIDFELQWGCQDMGSGESMIHTEQHKISRVTWEIQ